MNKKTLSITMIFAGLLVCLLILAYLSLNIGNFKISPAKVFQILQAKLFGTAAPEAESYEEIILLTLRLPRIIMVMLVGATLAVSGAVSQGIFRNPLVSPFILGVSSGASFGAAIAIVYFSQTVYSLDLFAGIGGAIAVIAAFITARRPDGYIPRLSLVLAGVIISSLFSSLVGILKYLADAETQLPAITFWMMGGFSSITWKSLDYVIILLPLFLLLMIIFAWQLNVLSMGDKEASFLGMSTERWKCFYLVLVVVSVGMCVARTGVIGWVGLVIPHIGRAIAGPDHKTLLPLSALLGASFLLISDNIARAATTGEIPIGIITAIIGCPFFIYYLKKREKAIWS